MVKKVSQQPPAERKPSPIHPYAPGDPIPVPEAVESDSDSAWGLWEDSVSPHSDESDTVFENTVPAALLPEPTAGQPKRRP